MPTLENKIKNLPQNPGIYLFYNKNKDLVYVGKATSLRSRVRSYFSGQRTSRPIEQMIHEVKSIKVKETDSVLEAIILEGNYIKKYRPKYNVDWKDDKSWNYIVFTDEVYPQVKTLRAHEYEKGNMEYGILNTGVLHMFGPYPGLKTREMMKLLQRLFFISTCKPDAKRECLYHQIGQCLGVCTGEINSKEYKQKVIRPLAMFLRGNKKQVINNLKKKMKEASKIENFEEATRLRNQIRALQRIQDIALLNKSFVEHTKYENYENTKTNYRIEGYDISNFGISGKVGSMVVFDSYGPVKSEYRKFKIKGVEGQSDVDCLGEVITRRLKHTNIRNTKTTKLRNTDTKNEWPLPNIILVDGGLPQVNRAKKILQENKIDIPVVGIAKGPMRKKNEFIYVRNTKDTKLRKKEKEIINWIDKNRDLLIHVRDEAHRFAIKYQRSLRKIK